jgi:formylglycine-generating enzyme required for sulfatase activity
LLHLRQNAGHVRASLAEQAQDRLVIETTYAEIRPSPGAVVSVCHADGALTCVVNEQGTTEVRAQNQTVTLRAGEASYVLEGQQAHQPICTNLDQLRIWHDEIKDSREDQNLGQVVDYWAKHGCNNVQPASSSGAPPASTSTPAALESAQASGAVAARAEGMVQIPAGKYEVGVGTPDKNHAPAQTVDLPVFWIDIAETTNAQYAQYLAEAGHSPPSTWPGGVLPAGKDEYPVEGLTFDDAQAFCQWAGKRLPKEVEWEVATRGPGADPPLYPWGNDPTAGGATFDLPQVDSYPVATVPFNVSQFGVFDTIGNVWEWTSTPYAETANGMQVLRGGRHGLLADGAFRQQSAPDDPRFRAVAGVRCAADDVAKENTP